MPSCCVSGCTWPSHKSYMFPKVNHQTETFNKLSIRRRDAWLTALGKTNTDPKSCERLQICDTHFISGKMAALKDVNNMDWVPTLNLGHTRNSSNILRCCIDGCVVSNEGGLCSFYRISKKIACGELKQVSDMRLSAWLYVLGQCDDVPATCENIYVCHAHYIIDMSATLYTSDNETISGSTDSAEMTASNCEAADNVTGARSTEDSKIGKLRLVSPKRVKSISTKQKSDFSKSGAILRNGNGQFSFSCSYCNAVNDDCRVMVNHINAHFDKTDKSKISTSRLPSSEFVSCTTTDHETMEPERSKSFREVTDAMSEPQPPTKNFVRPEHSRPLKRLLPKTNVDDLVASRPCKIERIKTVEAIDAPPTPPTKAPAVSVKFKPIRLPPLPAELAHKLHPSCASRSPGNSKNYELMYKDPNSSVQSTSSKDLCKTNEKHSTVTPQNSQCKLEPDVDGSMPILYKCKECDILFPNRLLYRTHFRVAHKPNDLYHPEIGKCRQCKLEPDADEVDSRPHQCLDCEVWFPNHFSYRTHYLHKHRLGTPRCYQCEMEPPTTNQSDPRRHICAMCKDWFANHAEFETHLKDDHDEYVTDNDFNRFANDYKEFNCYICKRTLKQREYLVCHMRCHFDKYLKYQCHLCGLRRFRTESVLKEHMKRHVNSPTKCDLCDKTFANSFRMRTHRQCHTSELNHKCPVCSKGFKLSKYLSRHMAVHNEGKIACRYCDATFRFSTGRRAHEKSVHNVL